MEGYTVGSTVALQQKGPGFESHTGVFLPWVGMLSLSMCVLSGFCGFLTQSINMTFKLNHPYKCPIVYQVVCLCDGLGSCPGFTPPATLQGQMGKDDGWKDK